MKQFKAGCSPITSTIYAGNVNDKGMWIGKKHDVTNTAVGAVAQHLLQLNEQMKFVYMGKEYVLQVVELKQQEQ